MTLLLVVGLVILLLLGAPLFVVLGGLALLLLSTAGLDPQLIAIEIHRITSSPNLVVIPLFSFAGVILAHSGMPARFVALAKATVGWIPGAAAIVSLAAFEFFTAFTGASGISILATGPMMYTVLRGAGYPDRFSLGLISSAGSLGVLLPPSIVVIFYGTLTRAPIDTLFLAGLLPSLLMLVLLAIYCLWRGRQYLTREPFEVQQLKKALWDARYELPLPVCVLGGLYSGLLTINEAASLATLYIVIVEGLLYRELGGWKQLYQRVIESMMLVGAILVVLGVALGVTNYAVDQGIPDLLLEWATAHISTPWQFLLALNVLLLIVGCVLDVFSALVLLVPLVTPLAMQYGVDPVHLGIIMLANLEIGYSTPPVGLNLFVSALTFKRPMGEVVRSVVPFVLILLLAVLIITFVPWLSTWPVPEALSGLE